MSIIILGQTLIVWSGILAALSFIFLMLTCSCIVCRAENKLRRLFPLHKYFVWSTIILVTIHVTLAMLASAGIFV